MSTLADRLKEAMEDMPDVKAVDIARACGIRGASIVDWQTGRTKKMEGSNLLATAELLRVNPWWLATGRGNKRAAYHVDPGHGHVSGSPKESSASWPFTAKPEDYERLTPSQRSALDSIVSAFLTASLADRESLDKPISDGTIKAKPQRARRAVNE